jgi:hypothetical protein
MSIFSRFSTLQNIGLFIGGAGILILAGSYSQDSMSEDSLTPMEGKVISVHYTTNHPTRKNKQSLDTVSLECQFDNNRKFYLFTTDISRGGIMNMVTKMKKSEKTKIWIEKSRVDLDSPMAWQLACDDVMYIDFKANQAKMTDNYYWGGGMAFIGMTLFLFPIVRKNYAGGSEEESGEVNDEDK